MDIFRALGLGGGGMMGMGGGGGGGMGGPDPNLPFRATYRCYPVVMMANKASLESGDKIILPTSALDQLARLRVTYPMQFKLTNKRPVSGAGTGGGALFTHAGVMEFDAEEGNCYLPYWMMQNLLIESGGLLEVMNVSLKKGTFVKFQPHSIKFTQLHNPRVVLERALRNFSCLTQGDTIAIQHGTENFYLDVKEVRPGTAISIIETDVNVDFDAPKDMPSQNIGSSGTAINAGSSSSASASSAAAGAAKSSPSEAFSFKGNAATHIPTNATAAQRDFSTGGWGSAGTEEEEKAAAAAAASSSSASASAAPAASGSSSYFANLGSGNKLTSKRGRVSSGATTSAGSSAQASPMITGGSSSGVAPPASSLGPSAASGSPSLKPPAASALARPQSASLAGRAGGYSLSGTARPAASASSSSSSSSAAAASSSSSSSAARPSTAASSSSSSISSLGLGVSAGTTKLIERQGNFNYHYEVDAKGHKRLIRRLPVSDKPAATPAATSGGSASATAAAAPGLMAGKGYSLK